MIVKAAVIERLDSSIVAMTLGEVTVVRKELVEVQKLEVCDVLGFFYYHPGDPFSARRCCQAALIIPKLGEIDGSEERTHLNIIDDHGLVFFWLAQS